MDYGKLDSGLVAALDEQVDPTESKLQIFIEAEHPLASREKNFLKQLGISGGRSGRSIITATLSTQNIDELSEQSWVKYLTLSTKLRPLDPT